MTWFPVSEERLLAAAEYSYNQWARSGLIARLFGLEAAGAAAAAEARIAAAIMELRQASLLAGAGGLVTTLVVPLAVWVGVFAALGAPYAQARALVKNEKFQSGFSQGFATGLLKWEWQHTVARFFVKSPGPLNGFDPSLSFIAANAYNEGLRMGYLHSWRIGPDERKAILSSLKSLSGATTRGGAWDRQDQISYVIALASAGRKHGVFKAA